MISKGKKLIDYILADFWSCGIFIIEMGDEELRKQENEYIVDYIKNMTDESFDRVINQKEDKK